MEFVKIARNTKIPVSGETWTVSSDLQEIQEWIHKGFNIALKTGTGNNVMAWDVDSGVEEARELFRLHKDVIGCVQRTRRGVHFLFEGSGPGWKYEGGDIKGDGGLVMFEPSVVKGFQYRVVYGTLEKLKPFPVDLIPRKVERKVVIEPEHNSLLKVYRAQTYAATVTCIAGQRAHNTLWRLVCWMRDLGLTQSEAYAVLLPWNHTNCVDTGGKPYPWSIRELTHKLEDAYTKAKR
jgi:hypothetical protein